MTIDELQQTLKKAVDCGKIGVPVALRMHLQMADATAELYALVSQSLEMAFANFRADEWRLMARRDPTGRQLNLLLDNRGGQTVLLTVGKGSAVENRLDLLLIGNHGIVRLEGAEFFEPTKSPTTPTIARWREFVEASLSQRGPVLI